MLKLKAQHELEEELKRAEYGLWLSKTLIHGSSYRVARDEEEVTRLKNKIDKIKDSAASISHEETA